MQLHLINPAVLLSYLTSHLCNALDPSTFLQPFFPQLDLEWLLEAEAEEEEEEAGAEDEVEVLLVNLNHRLVT